MPHGPEKPMPKPPSWQWTNYSQVGGVAVLEPGSLVLTGVPAKPVVYDVTYTFGSQSCTPSEERRRMQLCEEVQGGTSPASTSGLWLGMAYAAVLLGIVQLWFWIERWAG